tara:strand:+ start:1472 stop:3304 length:1833 start_codon:yes stop_codon:yes gene_type:complete
MKLFLDLDKSIKTLLLIILDFIISLFALYLSICLRIESLFRPDTLEQYILFLASPLVLIAMFYFNLIYKNYTRFIDLFYIKYIFKILVIYSSIFFVFIIFFKIDNIPRSTSLIYPTILITIILSSRILINLFYEYIINYNFKSQNVIIYGAGIAGNNLIKAIRYKKRIIALIDDDVKKQGNYINNIKISPRNEIKDLIEKYNVKEILFAISNLTIFEKKKIIFDLEKFNVKIQIVPDFIDIVEGNLEISDLRELKLNNLLGRDFVEPNQNLLKKNIENKIILITGAAGSIGREIFNITKTLKPRKIIALDQNEHLLFELKKSHENNDFNNSYETNFLLADLSQDIIIKNILSNEKIETIFHCAAYKHVGLVEQNKLSSIQNNILASYNICKFSTNFSVKNVVLISSDKAVQPFNVMGLTKRISEKIFQYSHKQSEKTLFSIVRFGNVLESSGSVIPIFREQIKQGGPLTVTDKNVKRYFMTIQEAAELVVQSSSLSQKGGEVFLLKMGTEVNIFELAKKMIKLSGFKVKDAKNPGGDIEIKITGLKEGEKISEKLYHNENLENTEHSKIMKIVPSFNNLNNIDSEIELIKNLIKENNQKKLINELKRISE